MLSEAEHLLDQAAELAAEGKRPLEIAQTLGITHFAARSIVAAHQSAGAEKRTISSIVSAECYSDIYAAALIRGESVGGLVSRMLETLTLDDMIDAVMED